MPHSALPLVSADTELGTMSEQQKEFDATSPQDEILCDTCYEIISFFTSDERPSIIPIWSYKTFTGPSCKTHGPLNNYITSTYHGSPGSRDGEMCGLFSYEPSGCEGPDRTEIIEITYKDRDFYFSASPANTIRPTVPLTREANINWIDFSHLKEFQEECEHNHLCCKNNPLQDIFTDKPQFLIDVTERRLVRYPPGARYITLSYVWGDAKSLSATADNLNQLLSSEGIDTESVPLTVRHAIELTKVLGERYLWCDALCIVQDDENKHQELAKMASIYANSSITIVAANGHDANHGLPGLRGISGPRLCDPVKWSLGESLEIQLIPYYLGRGYEQASSSRFWASRAWVLQERLFSQKKLIFCDGTAIWQCDHGMQLEHVTWSTSKTWTGLKGFTNLFQQKLDVTNPIPSIGQLGDIISEFNGSNLKYPEDALDAFSGLATALEKSWGQFISGLPATFFNLGLLWRSENTMERRSPRESSRSTCLPSWSWAGWKGDLGRLLWSREAGPFRLGHELVPRGYTKPTCTWQRHQAQDSQRTTIDFQWSSYQSRFINDASWPMPDGWTRYFTNDLSECLWFCDKCGAFVRCPGSRPSSKIDTDFPYCSDHEDHQMGGINRGLWGLDYVYAHFSRPGVLFACPVPTRDVVSCGSVPPMVYDPFISCITRRAWFEAGSKLHYNRYPRVSGNSSDIGIFHKSWQGLAGFLNLQNDIQALNPIELIELAKSRTAPGHWIDYYLYPDRRLYPYDERDFYDVMCIKWENGIAYRQGVGRILYRVWEKVEKDTIHVMLG